MVRADPKNVVIDKTGGSGMDIEWRDGHRSHFSFQWLRDACPCALCDAERDKSGRAIGAALKPAPGALPMFREPARPEAIKPTGKYALAFDWNDGHQHGIYSWEFLRQHCPCRECSTLRNAI